MLTTCWGRADVVDVVDVCVRVDNGVLLLLMMWTQ